MLDISQYAGLLFFIFLGFAFVAGVFFVSAVIRERGILTGKNEALQKSIYECGMPPIGTPYVSPNIRFYMVALLFVIFDVEAVFILPWAVEFRKLGVVGFVEMMVFLAILFVGLVYAWKKGGLRWE